MNQFKKPLIILLAVICSVVALLLIWKSVFTDPNIPRSYTDYEEYYDPNGFMDWTDFCWYQYTSADSISWPEDYRQVTEDDILSIKGYFDNTRDWLKTCDRLDEYEFDTSSINEGDAWLLFTSEGEPRGNGIYGKYDDYTLYFFDKESSRLYYLNNNI